MNLPTLLRVLARRRRLRRRERWSRDELLHHQAVALAELRAHALASSPFYRRLHAGKEARPFIELPVVTKADLMDHFDDVVVDRDVRLADVKAYLDAPDNEAAWGSTPFDVCATTETAGIASECEHHRLHLYEDRSIGMQVVAGPQLRRAVVRSIRRGSS